MLDFCINSFLNKGGLTNLLGLQLKIRAINLYSIGIQPNVGMQKYETEVLWLTHHIYDVRFVISWEDISLLTLFNKRVN